MKISEIFKRNNVKEADNLYTNPVPGVTPDVRPSINPGEQKELLNKDNAMRTLQEQFNVFPAPEGQAFQTVQESLLGGRFKTTEGVITPKTEGGMKYDRSPEDIFTPEELGSSMTACNCVEEMPGSISPEGFRDLKEWVSRGPDFRGPFATQEEYEKAIKAPRDAFIKDIPRRRAEHIKYHQDRGLPIPPFPSDDELIEKYDSLPSPEQTMHREVVKKFLGALDSPHLPESNLIINEFTRSSKNSRLEKENQVNTWHHLIGHMVAGGMKPEDIGMSPELFEMARHSINFLREHHARGQQEQSEIQRTNALLTGQEKEEEYRENQLESPAGCPTCESYRNHFNDGIVKLQNKIQKRMLSGGSTSSPAYATETAAELAHHVHELYRDNVQGSGPLSDESGGEGSFVRQALFEAHGKDIEALHGILGQWDRHRDIQHPSGAFSWAGRSQPVSFEYKKPERKEKLLDIPDLDVDTEEEPEEIERDPEIESVYDRVIGVHGGWDLRPRQDIRTTEQGRINFTDEQGREISPQEIIDSGEVKITGGPRELEPNAVIRHPGFDSGERLVTDARPVNETKTVQLEGRNVEGIVAPGGEPLRNRTFIKTQPNRVDRVWSYDPKEDPRNYEFFQQPAAEGERPEILPRNKNFMETKCIFKDCNDPYNCDGEHEYTWEKPVQTEEARREEQSVRSTQIVSKEPTRTITLSPEDHSPDWEPFISKEEWQKTVNEEGRLEPGRTLERFSRPQRAVYPWGKKPFRQLTPEQQEQFFDLTQKNEKELQAWEKINQFIDEKNAPILEEREEIKKDFDDRTQARGARIRELSGTTETKQFVTRGNFLRTRCSECGRGPEQGHSGWHRDPDRTLYQIPREHAFIFQRAGVQPDIAQWHEYLDAQRAYDSQTTHVEDRPKTVTETVEHGVGGLRTPWKDYPIDPLDRDIKAIKSEGYKKWYDSLSPVEKSIHDDETKGYHVRRREFSEALERAYPTVASNATIDTEVARANLADQITLMDRWEKNWHRKYSTEVTRHVLDDDGNYKEIKKLVPNGRRYLEVPKEFQPLESEPIDRKVRSFYRQELPIRTTLTRTTTTPKLKRVPKRSRIKPPSATMKRKATEAYYASLHAALDKVYGTDLSRGKQYRIMREESSNIAQRLREVNQNSIRNLVRSNKKDTTMAKFTFNSRNHKENNDANNSVFSAIIGAKNKSCETCGKKCADKQECDQNVQDRRRQQAADSMYND